VYFDFGNRRVLFTADPHLSHNGIISKCNRPFTSIGHMNDTIRDRWNAVARPQDIVIVAGDMLMGMPDQWGRLLAGLNGRKLLFKGNHDRSQKWYGNAFEAVVKNGIVVVNGVRYWVNHFPYGTLKENGKFRRPEPPGEFDIAICGHVHTLWKVKDGVINVGVDVWDFTPVGEDQLLPLVPERQPRLPV
jgi:calcineurin-like phosphoesterase family protein